MLNERKFTDKQTSRDERAINSLLKQAQVSAHSGDGTSKFSQMARDRASLLRKTQKHLKKIKDSVEYDEEVISEDDFAEGMKDQFKMAGISGRLTRPMKDKVKGDLKSGDVRTARDSSRDIHPDDMADIQALHKKGDKAGIARIIAARNKMDKPMGESFVNEEDSHVSADPRHPANQGGRSSRGGRMRNFPYIHKNPHTGNMVRHQLGNMTHTHPTTGEKVNTKGKLDTKTRGIPTKHEIRKAGETSEGYGQGPGYGKKGLKGFRKFLGKMDEAPSDENLKKYIDKAKKSEKSGRDAGFEGETASEREAGVRQVRNRKRGVKNAEAILRRRASDRGLDAENSFDAMDDRVVGR